MIGFFQGLAVFLTSAAGLVVEIVAGRLIAPYVGMSVYSWTAIIAVVLAGFSIGHWLGGLMADKARDRMGAYRGLARVLALAAASTLAAVPLLRLVAGPLLTSSLGALPVILAISGAVFFLPSLFVGVLSPVITKLAVDAAGDHAGPAIGRMYALSALGAIAGTVAAGFVFLAWLGSVVTLMVVAGLHAALALAFWWLGGRVKTDALAAVGIALAIVGWGHARDGFASPCERESAYFCLRSAEAQTETDRPSRLMALDHLVHGINDRDDPGWIASPYVQFVDRYLDLRHPGPKPVSAFFVGGGAFTLPRAWATGRPGSDLLVAEIDPAVTELARDRLWLADWMGALDIRHKDARWALQDLAALPRFDVVFGDAFHDIAVPAHLTTQEWHEAVAARLMPGGFYAINAVDRGTEPLFVLSLARTLFETFPVVEVWRSLHEISAQGRTTYIVVAGSTDSGQLILRANRPPDAAWVRLKPEALARRLAAKPAPLLLTDAFAPVDRLLATLLLDHP
ncbi:MAG: fused MFS/spermidine synthase [Rhodospirillales bacterium]